MKAISNLLEQNNKLKSDYDQLLAKSEQLVKALEWYANAGGHTAPTIKFDKDKNLLTAALEVSTERARQALSEFKGDKKC